MKTNNSAPTSRLGALAEATSQVLRLSSEILEASQDILFLSPHHYSLLCEGLRKRILKEDRITLHINEKSVKINPEREFGLYLFFGVVNYCFTHPYTLTQYSFSSAKGKQLRGSKALLAALGDTQIDWSFANGTIDITPDIWQKSLQVSSERGLFEFERRRKRIIEFSNYLTGLGVTRIRDDFHRLSVDEVFLLLIKSNLFDDPFLKRAQLTTAHLMECSATLRNSVPDLAGFGVMADYRIPQLLYNLGVIEFASASLRQRIINLKVVEPNSPEERALRASSVYVGHKLATDLGVRPAAIDALLWHYAQEYVQTHPNAIPHMLVPTDHY